MNRTFSQLDQDAFARLSGDYNPLHVDPLAARRLLFGGCVVHGIHAVLWALDRWVETHGGPLCLTKVNANFRAPVMVGQEVRVMVRSKPGNAARIEVVAAGVPLTQLDISWAAESGRRSPVSPELPNRQPCRERTIAELGGISGQLPICVAPDAAAALFPSVVRLLPAAQIATLLALTRLVGMEAPGMHSLFVGFDLISSDDPHCTELMYAAESFDDRFSLLELKVAGPGFIGQVRAAVRPRPQEQRPFAEVRQLVRPDEFRQERALVIGGSRGLGEVVVKGLSAGGADVRFTYHRGVADAERLVSELAEAGSSAVCFAYDVSVDAHRLGDLLGGWHPTLLGYFASPFIFSAVPRRFSYDRFAGFCGVYVNGFLQAAESVLAMGKLRRILYPSSAAIDELPPNLGEYAAAKTAGESLCAFLEKMHPPVRFFRPRLPRLPTDQTASLLSGETAEPTEIMLKILREMFVLPDAKE